MFNLTKLFKWLFIRPIVMSIDPGTGMAIMGGTSVLSGAFGSRSAEKAAKRQAAAIREQTAEGRRQYDQTRTDLAPWRSTGATALEDYSGYGGSDVLEGDYIPASEIPEFEGVNLYDDPGYQFRQAEQERAINRGAAGMGKMMSGNRLEELMSRSGDLASQEYGAAWDRSRQRYGLDAGREAAQYGRGVDAYGRAYGREQSDLNRLWQISEAGRGATSTGAQLGTQQSSNIGRSIAAGGASSAAGTLGQGAAWQQALGDVSALGTAYMMRPQGGYDSSRYNPSGREWGMPSDTSGWRQ